MEVETRKGKDCGKWFLLQFCGEVWKRGLKGSLKEPCLHCNSKESQCKIQIPLPLVEQLHQLEGYIGRWMGNSRGNLGPSDVGGIIKNTTLEKPWCLSWALTGVRNPANQERANWFHPVSMGQFSWKVIQECHFLGFCWKALGYWSPFWGKLNCYWRQHMHFSTFKEENEEANALAFLSLQMSSLISRMPRCGHGYRDWE